MSALKLYPTPLAVGTESDQPAARDVVQVADQQDMPTLPATDLALVGRLPDGTAIDAPDQHDEDDHEVALARMVTVPVSQAEAELEVRRSSLSKVIFLPIALFRRSISY